MNSKQHFSAVLQGSDGMDVAYIIIPFNVFDLWGKRGQVKVKAWFDGYLYRGSVTKMEKYGKHHFLIVNQVVRKEIGGKNPGDTVNVVLEQDLEERLLNIPEELQKVFTKNLPAEQFFNTLSYTNRKEYVRYITDAKRAETKLKRLEAIVNMLLNKQKNPTDKK